MRLASYRHVLAFFGALALCSGLAGCPEKGGTDKTTAEPERAEPERAEPEEEGKAEKKPAPAAAPADDKKPDEDKDKGGW
jgi:hypothetical protein